MKLNQNLTRALRRSFLPLLTARLACRTSSVLAFSPIALRSNDRFATRFQVMSTASLASSKIINLKELDQLTVRVIVDNESDTMTSGVKDIEGFEYIPEKQNPYFDDDKGLCCAGHGFSLLLTGHCRGESHTLLLDAGPDANLWQTNANKLGIQLKAIEAIVLSHYHWDHSGGLRGAIPAIQEPLLADLHSSQIVARGRPIPGDKVSMHKPANPSREELTELGAKVQIYDEEHTQCHDFFYVSGFIPRTTDFETGIPNHVSMVNGKWVLDELIADERYVACSIKNLGIVVFSSCSHAGIVNVCRDAMQKSGKPIFGVVGGFHLGGTQVEGRIPNTVEGLARVDPKIILAGHCTGWRAKARLAVDLADRYQPLAVGGTYVFRDSAPSSLR